MIVLAEHNTGMNWEIAAIKAQKLSEVLEGAKSKFSHDCIVEIDGRTESDGGPYWDNMATHYYLVVKGSQDTDSRFVQGIKDVLSAV